MAIDWIDVFRDTQGVLYKSRPYYKSWFLSKDPHDAIFEALQLAQPKNMHLLALECAHAKSAEESDKVNYLRAAGHIDHTNYLHRWTETPLSKYLAQHFPTVPSHHLREIASKYAENFDMVYTMEGIIHTMVNGPQSCMKKDGQDLEEAMESHPYLAYDPKFGWAMARHINKQGQLVGRAIVHVPTKTFVRTYGPRQRANVNQEDMALNSWLLSKGYKKVGEWDEGLKLAFIDFDHGSNDCEFLVPYLDGDLQRVQKEQDCLVLSYDGRWRCDNSDGTADHVSGITCSSCEQEIDPGDETRVGYHENDAVCSDCLYSYTFVTGRRGDEYYIHDDDAIHTIEGQAYDGDYLEQNGVHLITYGRREGEYTSNPLELYDGRVAVSADDDDLVCLSGASEHSDSWAPVDDCFYCEYAQEWFLTEKDNPIRLGSYTISEYHIRDWLKDNPEYEEEYQATLVDHSQQVSLPLEECSNV